MYILITYFTHIYFLRTHTCTPSLQGSFSPLPQSHTRVCTQTNIHTHMYTYTYTHTHIHAHTHTSTHTHILTVRHTKPRYL